MRYLFNDFNKLFDVGVEVEDFRISYLRVLVRRTYGFLKSKGSLEIIEGIIGSIKIFEDFEWNYLSY